MKRSIYDILARRYDELGGAVDYAALAAYLEEGCRRFGHPAASVLDLCCGTGSLSLRLAERGLDVTALDLSAEMLSVARERAERSPFADRILFLCQDMRSFELYGTVDAVVSTLDSLNHLASPAELARVFSLVRNYLEYGGIFCFDLNTRYKYETVYGQNDYILEEEGVFCGWRNFYDPKSGRAEFSLSVFSEREDGGYTREDAVQRERCFSDRTVKRALAAAGLEFCGVFDAYTFDPPAPESERVCYFARRPGND